MENLDLGINLGFGETSSVDNLIEKVNILEKSITNINEVSNVDMFTNALKNFQDLKAELKDIKSLLNEDNQSKDKGTATSSGKNPYKSETFSLSQTLLNIEKLLTEINSTSKKQSFNNEKYGKGNSGKGSKGNDNSNDNPFRKFANDELRKYYHNQEKTYKDKKLELNKVSKMTTKQFEDGFSKIVKGISKDVVDILDRDLLKKMVEKNATEMLKNSKYKDKESLDKKYEEISQLIKNAGFSSNIFKSSSVFRKGYNEKLYETENNKKIYDLKRLEVELKTKGINRSSNTDTMTGRQLEKLIEDNRRIYNIINSKHFQNFSDGQPFKSTEDKLNRYINQINDNKIKGQNIKENGLSLQNTIQQNSGIMIAGIEAFKYLGTISNFITSKDFERNMGALGIVGNLGNQASQNASKNRIIRESNLVGADINEFAEGVREVIKTGKTYEQSMNLVKTAGKVAVASFEDLTTATNILNQRFTALGISATDKNLNEFANRLQSALDNTALDLQDVNNAGRQTNTAMNALINSAEEKGIQGRSVEQYTMDVSNLELSLLSTLKQQGKTGEQSGIVLRTLFSKLMSVDGKGKVMLENDFKKMTKEEREKVGFGSVEEMTDMVLSGEVDKVIEGLSKMQKQGNLSYATIKKIFTERHASAISTLFTEVNGDTKKFIDNITTGINVSKNFGKAIENWAIKVERIFKNLKSISTNTFSRGIFGGVLGAGIGVADKLTDLAVKGQSSNNVFLSSFSQSIPQSMAQQFMFNNVSDFTQGKAYQKVESAYDLSMERIKNDKSLKKNRRKEILNQVELMKNQDLERIINGSGMSGFANQVKGATANVYDLSNKIKESVSDIEKLKEEGIESFSVLSGGAKELGASLWALAKPFLMLTAINMAINTVIGLYEKSQKLKNEADNLDKDIVNTSKIGKDIENIEKNINEIFKPENYQDEEENGYIRNVRKMIETNEELKSSIDTINAIKNNPFKNIQTIRDEIWKEKTKNSLIKFDDYSTQGRLGISNYKASGATKNYFTYGNTSRFSIGEWNDEYDRNYRVKYRGEKFNNISVIDKENEDRISKLSESKRHDELNRYKKMYNNNYVKSTDKAINNLYDDVYAKFKKELKNKGLDEKSVSDEDKQKYMVSNLRISNELVSNVFGKKSAEALNGKDVTDTESFYKLLNSLGGKDLQDNIKIFNDLIASGKIEPETLSLLTQYSKYQLNTIKEADDLFYKQLERNKESLEQSKATLENLKNKMVAMYDKTGLPSIAYGNILNEEKDEKGNLITLTQKELNKYNIAYNNDINSVPMEMSMNNIEGVREYQANMFAYYTKKAGLDKEIQDTQKNIEEAKKQGNLQEQQQLEAKLNWLNQDVKFLDQSKEMAKKVLHFSNFTAKKYDELLSMSAEIAKAQSVYRNMIGTSFGNQGSQMKVAYDSLNASRNLFNKVGKMNLNNQVNSAYIEDKDGAILQKITGKNDYSKVNMNDYVKLMDRIKDYRKNNISEKDGVNIETLQNQATVYSSIISERMNIQQQEIQLAQQEKQIHIDIVKYWLNEQKLKTEYHESGEVLKNKAEQDNIGTLRRMSSGDSNLYRMNDLQKLTNLKLENNNLKMKDQLDYARKQIAIAKENAQRQINAIRRLEGTNSINSRKSENVAKTNTNSTNKTIVDSANTISTNLINAMNSMMETMNSMSMSSDSVGETGVISDDIYGSTVPLTAKRETGKGLSIEASKSVSKDTAGSLSFGIFGINTRSGSYRNFYNMFKGQFPELSANGNASNWGMVAEKYGQPFINAQVKWRNSFTRSVVGDMDSFVKKYTGIKDNEGIKRVGVYLADYIIQAGNKGLTGNYVKKGALKNVSDWRTVLNLMRDYELKHQSNTFSGALRGGTASLSGLNSATNQRYTYAMNSSYNGKSGGISTPLITPIQAQKVNPSLVKYNDDKVTQQRGVYHTGHSYYTGGITYNGQKAQRIATDRRKVQNGMTQSAYDVMNLAKSMFPNMYVSSTTGGTHAKTSDHYVGMAFDIAQNGTNGKGSISKEEYKRRALKLSQELDRRGYISFVLDEANGTSAHKSGDHLHVSVYGKGFVKGGKSGNMGGNYLSSSINLPKEYIPNFDKGVDKLLQEITNHEFQKEMIRSEADEKGATFLAEKFEEIFKNSNNYYEALKNYRNVTNAYYDEHSDQDLSVTKDLEKSIENKVVNDLEVAKDSFEKVLSQFDEDVKDLNYGFEEMNVKVNNLNDDWERNYNFLNGNKLVDSVTEFTNTILSNNAKIKNIVNTTVKDIHINSKVIDMLNYFEKYNGVDLSTQEKRYDFLKDNSRLMNEYKKSQDRMFRLAEEQFKSMKLNKFAFANLSEEEKNSILEEIHTSLIKNANKNEELFHKSQNFDNELSIQKQLIEQIEKNNELRKLEIDNFKLFNKSIEDLSNGLKEMSDKMFNLENVRNLETTIKELNLLSKGIDIESVYGRKQMTALKIENSRKALEDTQQQIKTMLLSNFKVRSGLEVAGYNKEYFEKINLNNLKQVSSLADGVITYLKQQNINAKEIFNSFLEENPYLAKYKDLNLFDSASMQRTREKVAYDTELNDDEKQVFMNFLDKFENQFVNLDEFLQVIQKLFNNIKDTNSSFLETFKYFQNQSIDMLSNILFGTDTEWKGFNYKENLNYLFSLLSEDYKKIGKWVGDKFNNKWLKDKFSDDDINIEKPNYNNKMTILSNYNNRDRVDLGNYDYRTKYLNDTRNFDLNNTNQDNIIVTEKGEISNVTIPDNSKAFAESFINGKLNKVNFENNDYYPVLNEDGTVEFFVLKTDSNKTKLWIEHSITGKVGMTEDINGNYDNAIKNLESKILQKNNTSVSIIGKDNIKDIVHITGISTLNTPNFSTDNSQYVRVIGDIDTANDKFKNLTEKSLIGLKDKINAIKQYNNEHNDENLQDMKYLYEVMKSMQNPISKDKKNFKYDGNKKIIYEIVNQNEVDDVKRVIGSENKNNSNDLHYYIDGKEVGTSSLINKSRKITKKNKKGKKEKYNQDYSVIIYKDLETGKDYEIVNTLKNKEYIKKDVQVNETKEFNNLMSKLYGVGKFRGKITNTELKPIFDLNTMKKINDGKSINISYNKGIEETNDFYSKQNINSTTKNIEDNNWNDHYKYTTELIDTLKDWIDKDKDKNRNTSYRVASRGVLDTTIQKPVNIAPSQSLNRFELKDSIENTKEAYLDGKLFRIYGYDQETTLTGKNNVHTNKGYSVFYVDPEKNKKVYLDGYRDIDINDINKKYQEVLDRDRKDFELKYNVDRPNPIIEKNTNNSNSNSNNKNLKLTGEKAIRTPIDINFINTKSFNASDMPEFKNNKTLKGNEAFFQYLANKTGIPVEWLIAEANSESGFDKNLVDRYYDKKRKRWVESSYKGLYQIGKDYWTPKKAEEISKFFGVDISKDFSKGWSDPKQNALVMLYRMIENVEYQKKQGAKTYSFANGYYSHLLPAYAAKMNILGDNVKVKDFDRKAIKDVYLTNNPRHFIDGVNTTNGRAKEGVFNTGVKNLRDSGFFNDEYFNNLHTQNNKDNIVYNANDVLMVYDNALQQGILTINDKYLSASAEVSDYGDPAVRQYAKDTVGIKDKQNYQERSNTYKGEKFKGYYEGYDDPEYILDIGHFAGESNAYTKDGVGEYEFNREIIRKLAKEFEARGIKYGILEREKGAKKIDIDFVNDKFKGAKLIELHNNDDNDPNANGIEFLKSNQKNDNDFGFTMLSELHKATGMTLRGVKGQSPIHDGNGRQFAEGLTNLDNILVELGFLSNDNEVKKMLSNNSHDVVLGLLNGFLKASGKYTVTDLLTINKDGTPTNNNDNGNNSNKENETKQIPEVETLTDEKIKKAIDYYNVDLIQKNREDLKNNVLNQNEENQSNNLKGIQKIEDYYNKHQKAFAYASTLIITFDGMLKKQYAYKKKELEMQGKILEMNLQMAETTEERRKIEEQILQNKIDTINNDYNSQSSFMGGMFTGSMGFGIQGILSGATQGVSIGGAMGGIIGAGLGLVGGILGGTQAKIQAEQQKALTISQQKLTWLAEDRNRYLKTMANAMSEQAKWTTKVGVNDAISRSVKFALSGKDVIGGTAYETRTVGKKKKKGGGLLGSKKYDTVEAFTQSYNLNDSMFGGRQFNNRMDLEFAYTVLAQKLLGMQGNVNLMGTYGDMYYYNSPEQSIFGRFARDGRKQQRIMSLPIDNGLNAYLQRRLSDGSRELTASEFIKYFNGQGTLQGDGLLIDRSRDNEIDNIINNLKETAKAMPTGQQKVDTLALINFYENIKTVLDKEGKTTKRLFGNYYNIETEEVKDEKGNITEYRRVNESMWSDYYNQIYQNVMNGTKVFDTGSKFIQGTLNAFIQNVGSGRNTVKALTDEFNRLADEIYNVVTRTGEFSNVSGSIKGLIDNMALLKRQQRETENFTIDLAKRWVALGGNITDIVKDMNNGLTTAIDSIKSTMLGGSLEDTINNFGNNLFQKLGESMTTNLINQKYANSIFKMNSLLTNATDTNSISDIVNLANGYKGLSVGIENDRERLSAIQRLFTANRDIDYVDESIQYETGTSQSVTNNYTFTTDINAGTIVADELSKEILAQNLFAPLVQMLKDSGFIH